jgi:golgin subfamily B member 1
VTDADQRVTELEKALRNEPRPTADAEAEIRARLSTLYLNQLGDPLSAAVHVEALLARETIAPEVIEAATKLLEHRPIAARIAERLSTAYERLGQFASELAVLTKELALAKSPRLEQVKRRLADLHFDRLEDADGALQLLEPLVQKNATDDALRARFVEIASVSNQAPRAIRVLMRASRTEKDDGAKTRILCDLGELYFAEGEIRRARQAFLDAVTVASDPRALDAARRLLHIEAGPVDPKLVCAALEVSVRFEADQGARHAAAEKLLAAISTQDEDRATVAWRALLDSPRREEALGKLSELLEKRNDVQGLIEVLRAQSTSREAQARLIPLLEKAGLWAELAEVLDKQAGVTAGADAAAVLARLGRIRLSRLGDGEGAIRAFRRCLEIDPKNATSRSALEKMMREGAHRLEAAKILEETYRSQDFAEGLVRVFEARADLATPGERLPALAGAFEATEAAGLAVDRLLPLAEAALAEAARSDPPSIPKWLTRVQDLANKSGDPSLHAETLADSLGLLAIDCPERVGLACAAIDALLAARRTDRARALCAAGLASSPASVELLGRYDEIVGSREDAGDRLRRYQTALERTADQTERRRIMQVIAAICRESLDDLPRAIELWQRILKEDPANIDALVGLFGAYERLENPEALFAEMEQALETLEGEPRQTVLLRKAAALAKFGEREQSSEIRGELLKQPHLRHSVVESILTAAYEDDQPEIYREALEIQANAEDPATRMLALERLGDFHFERLGDRRAAIDSWKPAARLYTKESAEDEHARELYERVLDASPDDREAAWKLVEIYAKAGDWVRVPEVYGALLRSEGGLDAAIERLLELEGSATEAGAVDDYVSMVDETVPRLSAEARDSLYRLIQAKARILGSDPARQAEASDAHKYVIETFGGEKDIAAFQTFVDTRGSADDRQADLRWLYAFRANRSPNPGDLLVAWAKTEEDFGDVDTAIQVYERARSAEPNRRDALEALARLKRASADFEGCIEALRALREQTEASRVAELDLTIARILVGELDRPIEAVEAAAPHLRGSQRVKQALSVVRRAIRIPDARTRTIELVESAIGDATRDAAEACLGLLVEEAGRDSSVPVSTRRRWYATVVELRGNDIESALESALDGVEALPNEPSLWELVERVAQRADRPDRLVEAYRRAIEGGMAPEQHEPVGRRIVRVLDESSSDSDEILRSLQLILEHVPGARWALDRVKLVLSAQGRWDDLFQLYDRAVEGTKGGAALAELLNEAAVAARDLGRNHERAVSYLEKLVALRPDDASVQAALERLYERHGLTAKLIELLSTRVEGATGHARMELSHRIASLWLDLGRYDAALGAVETMLERGAPMEEAKDVLERMIAMRLEEGPREETPANVFERTVSLLTAHYSAVGLTDDLIRITKAALALSSEPASRARCAKDLVRLRLETQYDIDDAFSVVRSLVASDIGDDPALQRVAGEALLDEAAKDWQRRKGRRDCDAARTSHALILELSELCLSSDNPKDAIVILTKGVALPFEAEERRALRSRIAFTLADRADDAKRAIAAFQELFDEDAGDDVAALAAERFAALLEEAGKHKKRAELWERVGEAQGRSKSSSAARNAWVRAADLWAAQKEPDRAIAAYREAAALGSSMAIEALARLYADKKEWMSAAQALEWLFDAATAEAKVSCGLAIADAYVRVGERDLARSRLAELLVVAPRDQSVRERLVALYREDSVWGPLANLLASGATTTDDRDERLRLLVESVEIYLRQLSDPERAIPLAQSALELDPESTELCLDLGEALVAVGRHDDAVAVFRRGLGAPGDRRPKNAGLLHKNLARALLRAGRRSDALDELGTAARLSPTEPSILYDLAKLATEEGNLDVAERTLRALLLALHHPAQATAEAPSRAEVYLDLSRVLEAKGDSEQANELVESAFDSALESSSETVRLEQALERRGRYDLMTVAIERRLRSATGPTPAASALDALVSLWEGPLGRTSDMRAAIARHAEIIARDVDGATNVDATVWAALVRAHAATGEVERAAAIIEPLFIERPTDRTIWEALRDLHTRLDNRDRLVELAETALSSAKATPERNLLRLDLATLLLDQPPKVDAAVTTLRKLLEDDPGNVAASTLLSSALESEGRHEELVSVLSAMLSSIPAAEDPEANVSLSMRLARALEGASRTSDAKVLYARLSKESATTIDDLRSVAARLDALGSDALPDCLERLARLETGPEAAASARRLVDLRTASGDAAGTLRALTLGFAADPGDSVIVQRLVEAHQQNGDQESALSVLNQSLRNRSSDVELLRMRAWLHDAAGRHDDALADLETALQHDPSLSDDLISVLAHATAAEVGDDGRRSLELFDLLLRVDQSAEARAVVERLLERSPNHVGGLERLASLCASEGDWASARGACQRLLPLLGGDPDAVARVSIVLADACERRDDLADAKEALEHALELVPGSAEIRTRLAKAYEAAGEKERLADLLEAQATETSDVADQAALLVRAAELVLDSGGAVERALELAQKSRDLDPSRVDTLLVHARAQAKLGRLSHSLATLREVIKSAKGRGPALLSRAYFEMANIHLARDEIFEAFDALNQSFNADPKHDEAGFLLGLVAIDLDDERTALRALRTVTATRSTLGPTDKAIAFYHLARIARVKGDLRRAKQMATSAVAANADHAQARALLDAL